MKIESHLLLCHWNFTLGNNTEEGKKCGSLFPQSKFDSVPLNCEVANIGTYIFFSALKVFETLYEVYEFLYSAIDH